MKTSVNLPDDLLRQIRARAIQNGRTLEEMIVELLRIALGESEPSLPQPLIKEQPLTGLPFFVCHSDAPARRTATSDLLAFEQELQTREDLARLGIFS